MSDEQSYRGTQQPVYAIGSKVPIVARSAWIAPTATVLGEVILGEQASVWYGAVLRGDGDRIVLGARSNVQDCAVIHADMGVPCHIGDGVTVGHGAVVHGARIDDDCLIGLGARVLNGAHVGHGSLVAAGALLPEGFEAQPYSLIVGAPARVRRELGDDEVREIEVNAREYVDSADRHSRAVRPISGVRPGSG